MTQVKFSANIVAGVAAIASALVSFEAFESRFRKLGEHRFLTTLLLMGGSAFSATGADVRATGIACLAFLLAFYYVPEVRDGFPLLHFDDIDAVVRSVTAGVAPEPEATKETEGKPTEGE